MSILPEYDGRAGADSTRSSNPVGAVPSYSIATSVLLSTVPRTNEASTAKKSGLGQRIEIWYSGSSAKRLGSKDSTTPRIVASGSSSVKKRRVVQLSTMKYLYKSWRKDDTVWSTQSGFNPKVIMMFRFPVLLP